MQNPLTTLISLQLNLVNQYVALARNILNFYLSLQPLPMKQVRVSNSRSLVPVDRPSTRRSR